MVKKKHPIRTYFHENESMFYIFVVIVFLLLFLLALGPGGMSSITGFIVNTNSVYVDPYIYHVLEESDYASIVVEGSSSGNNYGLNSFKLFDGGFSAKVNSVELEQIIKSGVDAVYYDYPFNLLLSDSVPLIQGDLANALQVGGEHLTGKGLSACVIDTGVNNHEAFQDRLIDQACFCSQPEGINGGCCPNGLNEQYGLIGDLHGHGTHVAGIIAANGVVKGVAPESNIVAVRVLNSTGGGVSSDLVKALQYCIDNSEKFNISVISMSLGCGLYTSDCDGMMSCDLSLIENEVDQGEAKGIIFVASSGNSGSKTSLAAPSCLSNVISVGSSTKQDELSTFSNRNDALDLLAPGSAINSLSKDGGLRLYSGTSQAAPHVSGSVLLLKQKDKSLDYNQIKDLLFENGVAISDTTTGKYYVRINLYNSIVAMGDGSDIPQLIVYEPVDNSNVSGVVNIKYYANDTNLTEVYFTLNDSAKVVLNGNVSLNLPGYGTYTLKIYANDTSGNINMTTRTVYYLAPYVSVPQVTLSSPNNGAILPSTTVSLDCSSISEVELDNISLYLSTSNLSLDYNKTLDVNGKSASFGSILNLSDNTYYWNCLATDLNNSKHYASSNYSFSVDTLPPIVELNDIEENDTIKVYNYDVEYRVSDNSTVTSCNLNCGNVVLYTHTLPEKNTWLEFTVTGASNYECYVNCVDVMGLSNQSVKWKVEVPVVNTSTSTTTGGGASVDSPSGNVALSVPDVDEEDVLEGSVPVVSDEPAFDGKGLINDIQFSGGNVAGLVLKELTENILGVELPTELAYKFFSLSGSGNFDSAKLIFNVERVWVEQNGLTNEDITLWGYDGKSWLPLETSFVGESGETLNFESSIKSLTTFAISTKTDKLNNNLNAASDEGLSSGWIWFMSIFGFVLALSSIGLVIFKRKGILQLSKFLPFKKKIQESGVLDKFKGKGIKGDSDSEVIFED